MRKPEDCFSVVMLEGVSVARGEVFEAMNEEGVVFMNLAQTCGMYGGAGGSQTHKKGVEAGGEEVLKYRWTSTPQG